MSRGAEVTSGNVNWCAMPKPDRHPTVVVKFKSRSGKSESKTEWMDPGSVSTVRTSRWWYHGKQSDRQEAFDTVVWGRKFWKCSEDLPKKGREEEEGGGAGKEEMFSGLGWVTRWGHVQEWKGWHQVRGVGRLRGREARAQRSPPPRLAPMCPRIHWSTFLNIVQQTMESETEENMSITQDKPVHLEGGEVSEPKGPHRLHRFMTKWLTSPPRPETLFHTWAYHVIIQSCSSTVWWLLKIRVPCSHFLNMKGPQMNPTEARKQWNPNTGSRARGTKRPRSVRRKGMS